jgi:regulator of replication initiation timing
MSMNAAKHPGGRPSSFNEAQEKLMVSTILREVKSGKQINEAIQAAADVLNAKFTKVRGYWYLHFSSKYKQELEQYAKKTKSNNFTHEEEVTLASIMKSAEANGDMVKTGLQRAMVALNREYQECHTQWYTYTRKKLEKGILRLTNPQVIDQAMSVIVPPVKPSVQTELQVGASTEVVNKPNVDEENDRFAQGLSNIKNFITGVESIYNRNKELIKENEALKSENAKYRSMNSEVASAKAEAEKAREERDRMKKEYDEFMEAINGARKFFVETEM